MQVLYGLASHSETRRWRLWGCWTDPNSLWRAFREMKLLQLRGIEVKVWRPRPEHYQSGHTHIAVLVTETELRDLAKIFSVKVADPQPVACAQGSVGEPFEV